jgi:hypothetical protein
MTPIRPAWRAWNSPPVLLLTPPATGRIARRPRRTVPTADRVGQERNAHFELEDRRAIQRRVGHVPMDRPLAVGESLALVVHWPCHPFLTSDL